MSVATDTVASLLDDYSAGPQLVKGAVQGLTPEQLHARPIAGKWSIHEVVCHLADAEILYVDRMKRVIAEDKPTLLGMDPDVHVPALARREREVAEELLVIELLRSQMSRILRTLRPDEFQRVGMHSEAGPLTLQALLARIVEHVPHHVGFIRQKREALGC